MDKIVRAVEFNENGQQILFDYSYWLERASDNQIIEFSRSGYRESLTELNRGISDCDSGEFVACKSDVEAWVIAHRPHIYEILTQTTPAEEGEEAPPF